MSQKCPRSVQEVSQRCPRSVIPEVSQKCPRSVPEVSQKCPRSVSEVSQVMTHGRRGGIEGHVPVAGASTQDYSRTAFQVFNFVIFYYCCFNDFDVLDCHKRHFVYVILVLVVCRENLFLNFRKAFEVIRTYQISRFSCFRCCCILNYVLLISMFWSGHKAPLYWLLVFMYIYIYICIYIYVCVF